MYCGRSVLDCEIEWCDGSFRLKVPGNDRAHEWINEMWDQLSTPGYVLPTERLIFTDAVLMRSVPVGEYQHGLIWAALLDEETEVYGRASRSVVETAREFGHAAKDLFRTNRQQTEDARLCCCHLHPRAYCLVHGYE